MLAFIDLFSGIIQAMKQGVSSVKNTTTSKGFSLEKLIDELSIKDDTIEKKATLSGNRKRALPCWKNTTA